MKVNHTSSQLGVPVTNAIAERNNQDILNGARCGMGAAGLPACCWPYAGPPYCLMVNIAYDQGAESPWPLTHKNGEFKGLRVPFGTEALFMPSETPPSDLPGKWEGDSLIRVLA